MFKLETHCHTYKTSHCATTPNQMLIDLYKNKGYNGIVVTNHFSKTIYNDYLAGATHAQKMDNYFNAFYEFKSLCNGNGIKAFLGAEVRVVDKNDADGTEYIILGFSKDIFYKEKLFNLTQAELFSLVNEQGALMYQSHPFRTGVVAGDPKYMHGAESFNGHYHHKNDNDKALEFCVKNDLIKLSGTDFHHEDQPITAGIILPSCVDSEKELANEIFNGNFTLIKDVELYEKSHADYIKTK